MVIGLFLLTSEPNGSGSCLETTDFRTFGQAIINDGISCKGYIGDIYEDEAVSD